MELLRTSKSFNNSENVFLLVEPYYKMIDDNSLNEICRISIDNGQIWGAGKCARYFIPKLFTIRANDINKELYSELKFQIDNGEWYKYSTNTKKII